MKRLSSSVFGKIFFIPWIAFFLVQCGCKKFNAEFDRPQVICVSPDESKLAIYDSRNFRVLLTTPDFFLLKSIEHPFFYNVGGICISDDNEILVTNGRETGIGFNEEEKRAFAMAEILVFDFEGVLKDRLSWEGERGPIVTPTYITPLSDRTFLVSDDRQNKLFQVDRKGEILRTIGGYGDEPGKLYLPLQTLRLPDGDFLVVDCYNSRLQIFDSGWNSAKVAVESGEMAGRVKFPQSVALDEGGRIYCSEAGTMRVSLFEKNFCFLKTLEPKRAANPSDSQPPKTGSGNPLLENESVESNRADGLFELLGIVYLKTRGRLIVLDAMNSCFHLFDRNGTYLEAVKRVKTRE